MTIPFFINAIDYFTVGYGGTLNYATLFDGEVIALDDAGMLSYLEQFYSGPGGTLIDLAAVRTAGVRYIPGPIAGLGSSPKSAVDFTFRIKPNRSATSPEVTQDLNALASVLDVVGAGANAAGTSNFVQVSINAFLDLMFGMVPVGFFQVGGRFGTVYYEAPFGSTQLMTCIFNDNGDYIVPQFIVPALGYFYPDSGDGMVLESIFSPVIGPTPGWAVGYSVRQMVRYNLDFATDQTPIAPVAGRPVLQWNGGAGTYEPVNAYPTSFMTQIFSDDGSATIENEGVVAVATPLIAQNTASSGSAQLFLHGSFNHQIVDPAKLYFGSLIYPYT